MFKKKLAVVSIVLAGLMGTSGAVQAAEQMDNGVWFDGFRLGSSRTGRMVMFFFAKEHNGKVSICGNYFMYGGGAGRRRLERGLNSYRFFYNGNFVLANASFLWRAPTEDRIGEQISCADIDAPYAANSNDLLGGNLAIAR